VFYLHLLTDLPVSYSKPKRAGVYLLATDGEVAPNAVTYMEAACSYEQPMTIHPFAYRTHAHDHGGFLCLFVFIHYLQRQIYSQSLIKL